MELPQALGLEAEGERLGDEQRIPAAGVDAQRRMQVLGDGAGREAADVVESLAAQNGARADEERRVPTVFARLDDVVEHPLLAPRPPATAAAEQEAVVV